MGEVLNEVLRGFNLRDFKALKSIDARVEYAGRILPHMGTGSSRIVFALSGGKVLKIARNKKGIAQNQAEIDVYLKLDQAGLGQFVATIFDYDPKNTWVLAQIAKPFPETDDGEEQFEQASGISWAMFDSIAHRLGHFGMKLANIYRDMKDSIQSNINRYQDRDDMSTADEKYLNYNLERMENLEHAVKANPKLLKALEFMLGTLKLAQGDVVKVDHWGTTIDGRVVLVDYGATMDVIHKFYQR